MSRGLEFQIKGVEELYILYIVNKGADQLQSYRAADLRLWFSHMPNAGFLMMRPILKRCFMLFYCCIMDLIYLNMMAKP